RRHTDRSTRIRDTFCQKGFGIRRRARLHTSALIFLHGDSARRTWINALAEDRPADQQTPSDVLAQRHTQDAGFFFGCALGLGGDGNVQVATATHWFKTSCVLCKPNRKEWPNDENFLPAAQTYRSGLCATVPSAQFVQFCGSSGQICLLQ